MGGPLALLGRGTWKTTTPQLEVAKQMERVFFDHLLNPDATFGGWGETMPGFLGDRGTFRLPPEEGAFQIPIFSLEWGGELSSWGLWGGARWTSGSPPGKGLPELWTPKLERKGNNNGAPWGIRGNPDRPPEEGPPELPTLGGWRVGRTILRGPPGFFGWRGSGSPPGRGVLSSRAHS